MFLLALHPPAYDERRSVGVFECDYFGQSRISHLGLLVGVSHGDARPLPVLRGSLLLPVGGPLGFPLMYGLLHRRQKDIRAAGEEVQLAHGKATRSLRHCSFF